MTLDKILLEKSKEWTTINLGIESSLIDEYIGTDKFEEKRDLILKIMEDLHKRYLNPFYNCFEFLPNLKKFEEDFLYKYLFYRDHFLHLFQVFLLGCFILEETNKNDFPIDNLFDISPERLIRTWLLISFYHDIGYFVEKLISIGEEIQKLYFNKISGLKLTEFNLTFNTNLENVFKNQIKTLTNGIVNGEKYILTNTVLNQSEDISLIIQNELESAFINRDHGIISALFLNYTMNLEMPLIEMHLQRLILQDLSIACLAMSTHSIEKSEKIHLNFENHNLGCLLVLCDNIQEWNRPRQINDLFKELDIWESLDINIDQQNRLIEISFKINDKIERDELKTMFKRIFNDLKRIFTKTLFNGPNFMFKIQGEDTFLFKATLNNKKRYEIEQTFNS